MKNKNDKLVEISTIIPIWLIPLIRLFSHNFFFSIGMKAQNEIQEAINKKDYDNALDLIADAEKKWGYSNFTTRLETRINRIRILGK